MTIVADTPPTVDTTPIFLGVDTHADTNTAAITDPIGRHLGDRTFNTTPAGNRELLAWANEFGPIHIAGVEGTGCYGAHLARFLTGHDIDVVEVDRPDRKTRRHQGKSDPIDAYAAALAAGSGRATGIPKTRTGTVEAIRVLRVARTGAVRSRARALTQLRSLQVTTDDDLQARLSGLGRADLVRVCARLRPGPLDGVTAANKTALRSIARRVQHLDDEIVALDRNLEALITPFAPTLLALFGVGTDAAGQLLVTVGDNPDRIHSEAAFAHLCGVAPIPASSGKTTRHRLNRGGDRQANAALYRIVICRLSHDDRTRSYLERRTAEGKSRKEIIRCLKRYVAREVFNAIRVDLTSPQRAS